MSRLAPDVGSLTRSQLRSLGLTGLVGTGLLFASVIAGSPDEPPLDASTAEAAAFVKGQDARGCRQWRPSETSPRW